MECKNCKFWKEKLKELLKHNRQLKEVARELSLELEKMRDINGTKEGSHV